MSQKGLLFKAKNPPPLASILLIETDLKTLANCVEIEDALLELNGRIVGKVVRVMPDAESSLHEIGVQFIRVGEEADKDVSRAIEMAGGLSGASARV